MTETAENLETNSEETHSPKDFRAQIAALSKALQEKEQKLQEFEAQARVTAVKEAVTSLGLPQKVADLVPSDTPPDKVGEWLKDYADVFAPKATGQAEQSDQTAQGEQFQQAVTQMRQLEREAKPAPGSRDAADVEALKTLAANTATFRDFRDGLRTLG